MKSFIPKVLCLGVLLAPLSCTDSFQGTYQNPKSVEIIDDRWSQTDANDTAKKIIDSVLDKPWLTKFMQSHKGALPVVIVDDIANRTSEHIDTAAIGQALQDELINSGKIDFVDKAIRQKILDEIKYHNESGMVSRATAKKKGEQTGADFLMVGEISSIVNQEGGIKLVTYTTTVRLTELSTSKILFSKSHQIQKKFKRSGAGF